MRPVARPARGCGRALTTHYATWQDITGSPGVRESVFAALGYDTSGYDVPAVVDEYRAAIDAALPRPVALRGDDFVGPCPAPDGAWSALAEAVNGIDLWRLTSLHRSM